VRSSRRRTRVAVLTAALLAAGAASAVPAPATDSSPCAAEETVAWWNGPVQSCPLFGPLPPNGWIPVYAAPVAHDPGTPVPAPPGWLHVVEGQRFVCQEEHPNAEYYHPSGYRNRWWAFTRSDDQTLGWVPEVFFRGGANDEPDGGLRRCPGSATTAVGPSAPAPPQAGAPADGDGDGAPDADDKCPNESARPRDANLNGCLDYALLRAEFKLTPAIYVRRAGNRYKPLGITVRRLTATGLPNGARIVVRCTRSSCPTQRATVRSGRRVEFERMRGRKLRSGVRMHLRATLDGAVGAGATYTVMPNDTRKREFCLRPGTTRRGGCSTKR